jgi:hypothetical protein
VHLQATSKQQAVNCQSIELSSVVGLMHQNLNQDVIDGPLPQLHSAITTQSEEMTNVDAALQGTSSLLVFDLQRL